MLQEIPKISLESKCNLEDIFLLDGVNEYRDKFDTYQFNGLPVPRVSNILDECISKNYLIAWAAKIGVRGYYGTREKATVIGSRVHEMIENYLLNRTDLDVSYKTPKSYIPYINTAYNNFKNWEKYLNNLGYHIEKIIAIEKKLSCPYYGGTADLICVINGKVYIIDFKTSKQISYQYIVQVCAYMWIINNDYCKDSPHVDGIGIIRVDKEKENEFEDLFLNSFIPEQNQLLDQYTYGFGSLLMSYYQNINMKYLFNNYKNDYSLEYSLGGIS